MMGEEDIEAGYIPEDLRLLLSDSLSPLGVEQWMHAKNRLLGGRQPIALLAAGQHEEVRAAAESFIAGSYV